jgi:hypothetical protein
MGHHALEAEAIAARIATTETSSWIPFAEKHHRDRAVVQSDRQRIERTWQAQGYFDERSLRPERSPQP